MANDGQPPPMGDLINLSPPSIVAPGYVPPPNRPIMPPAGALDLLSDSVARAPPQSPPRSPGVLAPSTPTSNLRRFQPSPQLERMINLEEGGSHERGLMAQGFADLAASIRGTTENATPLFRSMEQGALNRGNLQQRLFEEYDEHMRPSQPFAQASPAPPVRPLALPPQPEPRSPIESESSVVSKTKPAPKVASSSKKPAARGRKSVKAPPAKANPTSTKARTTRSSARLAASSSGGPSVGGLPPRSNRKLSKEEKAALSAKAEKAMNPKK